MGSSPSSRRQTNENNPINQQRENNVRIMNEALNAALVPNPNMNLAYNPPPNPVKNSKTIVINNDMAIRKKTIVIENDNEGKFWLKFNYDCCFREVEIAIYLFFEEKRDLLSQITKELVSGVKNSPYMINEFQPGKDVSFPRIFNLNFQLFDEKLWITQKEDYYPLIIKMSRKKKNETDEKKCIYNYLTFIKEDNNYKLKFLRQKLELNNQAYEIQEIYGINQSGLSKEVTNVAEIADTEKECVICFSEKIDTIIMPCRHMCLCIACAHALQSSNKPQTKKCPVCRKNIESFIRLQRDGPKNN